MSKLEDLIQEYCPDGVEYRALREIAVISRGRVISKDYIKKNEGVYPVYSSQTERDGELGRISTYDYDGEYITWTTDGANAGSIFYRNGKFSITNVCGLISPSNDVVCTRFLFFALEAVSKHYVSSGMGNPKLMSNVMEKVTVPVPPIEVQNKIVQILDTFTELTAELTAELSARQKQYEYYRDMLVKFDGQIPGVEYKELSAVCKSLPKGTLKQEELVQDGLYPVVNSGKELYGHYNDFNNDGDAVIVASRGNAGYVSYQSGKFWAGGLCYPYASADESTVSTKYIYYALKAKENTICNTLVSKGGVPALNKQDLDAVKIPVPPIDVQQQVVSILDQFYTLSSDISTGLPAEIAAREKQYEFFRDKILTFKGVTPPPHDSRAADCG